ncbi:hypothetical protein [Microbacterium sp. 18062]|uniref:hypothetical protein n=1 Tax=Microbacterium sp. 18062 TaxID=2681410 RepID=UPI001F44C0E1|nr:hypothetical protein [Microbacterium sp. 18062]
MARLLVRAPSPLLADGELTHLDRVPVDAELAHRQWLGYVEAYRARGWEIVPARGIRATTICTAAAAGAVRRGALP